MTPNLGTHSPHCIPSPQAACGGWGWGPGQCYLVCVISTFLSLSGTREGYSPGLDFLLVLLATTKGLGRDGPLLPSFLLSLFLSLRGCVVPKASGEQCPQTPGAGEEEADFEPSLS